MCILNHPHKRQKSTKISMVSRTNLYHPINTDVYYLDNRFWSCACVLTTRLHGTSRTWIFLNFFFFSSRNNSMLSLLILEQIWGKVMLNTFVRTPFLAVVLLYEATRRNLITLFNIKSTAYLYVPWRLQYMDVSSYTHITLLLDCSDGLVLSNSSINIDIMKDRLSRKVLRF